MQYQQRRHFYTGLAMLASLVIIALSGMVVWTMRADSILAAETTVQNVVEVEVARIENNLENLDGFLQVISHRFAEHGSKKKSELDYLFTQLSEEVPSYRGILRLLICDARGNQIFNSGRRGRADGELPNLSDRDYFAQAKAGASGLIYQGPLQAKLDQQWSMIMARSMVSARGEFQGLVVALVPIRYFSQGFEALKLGSNGVANLRTTDLAQVARYPELKGLNQGVGNRTVSQTFRSLIDAHPEQSRHVYRTVAPVDGFERVYAVRRFAHAPFWMTVGMGTSDFQGQWRAVAVTLSAIVGGIIFILFYGARRLDAHGRHLSELVDRRTRELTATSTAFNQAQAMAKIGSWSLAHAAEVFDVSPEAATLFGRPGATSLSPEEWAACIHPDDREPVLSAWQAALEGAAYDITYRIVLATGEIRWLHALAAKAGDAEKSNLKALGTVQDVTELKRYQSELTLARTAAEEANQAKSAFLATMSHEIRTPLNALIGTAYLLGHSKLSAEQQEDLQTIESAGRNLLALINDILDISKIEAGELAIDPHVFSLQDLLGDLRRLFTQTAAGKGIRLDFDFAGVDLQRGLVGDGHRLRQCLINLLSNAIKFTERGGVTLTVTELPGDGAETGCRLRFTVRDTGLGMNAAMLKRLFTPFSQADTSTSRRFGGSGLGLSIVKRVTELMHGSVGVDSQEGEGSTFWLELPFGIGELPVARLESSAGVERPLKLLVVDDDAQDRSFFARLGESFGWQVQAVGSGREMIDCILASVGSAAVVDCVILDWRLPEMDGLQAFAELKNRLGDTPMPSVIMVTAAEKAELMAVMRDERPDSVLIKPVAPSTLFNAVNEAVIAHGCELDRLLLRTQISGNHSQWLQDVELLVVDDSHLNLDVIGRVLLREGARPTLCDSGYQALDELERAPQRFDAVLMDLQMPVLDGCDTTLEIRKRPGLAGLPVIALTAGATLSEQQRARESGMDDFLTKPVDPVVLIRTVRRYVEQRRGVPLPVVSKALAPSAAESAAEWPDLPGVDLAEVHRLVGDDLDFYRGLLDRFVNEVAELLREARAHQAAGDGVAAARPIHRLRGQAGNVAARPLSALAGKLEEQALANTLSAEALHELEEASEGFVAAYRVWAGANGDRPRAESQPQPGSLAVDREQLEILRGQLSERSMSAIATARVMSASLRAALGEDDYQTFDNAIAGLQFAVAAGCLERLQREGHQ